MTTTKDGNPTTFHDGDGIRALLAATLPPAADLPAFRAPTEQETEAVRVRATLEIVNAATTHEMAKVQVARDLFDRVAPIMRGEAGLPEAAQRQFAQILSATYMGTAFEAWQNISALSRYRIQHALEAARTIVKTEPADDFGVMKAAADALRRALTQIVGG